MWTQGCTSLPIRLLIKGACLEGGRQCSAMFLKCLTVACLSRIKFSHAYISALLSSLTRFTSGRYIWSLHRIPQYIQTCLKNKHINNSLPHFRRVLFIIVSTIIVLCFICFVRGAQQSSTSWNDRPRWKLSFEHGWSNRESCASGYLRAQPFVIRCWLAQIRCLV